MSVSEVVTEVEAAGAAFRLDGERIRVSYPDEERRKALAGQIALLKQQRAEVTAYLKARSAIPLIPKGIRLVEWKLKGPPVAIETYAVVVDTGRFAKTTLQQLQVALENPNRWVGWTIPQLIDRLAQVGVRVMFDSSAFVERRQTGGQ